MVLVVVMMGGLLLAATAVAGLLTVYQIRQSNDTVSSAQAFFAADAALEWQLANTYGGYEDPLIFSLNGVSSTSSVTPIEGVGLDFVSQGFSGHTVRVLETVFTD